MHERRKEESVLCETITPDNYMHFCFIAAQQVAELSARLECMEIDTKSVHTQKRMELKVKELESRVELEQTSKSRLEVRVDWP